MNQERTPVVASLPNRAPHPGYKAIALSPTRQHAIVAGKDTLRVVSIGPEGLKEVRSLRISQHFQTATSVASTPNPSSGGLLGGRSVGDVRDTFGLTKQKPASPQNTTVGIEDVAWSLPQIPESAEQTTGTPNREDEDSLVAVSGSNGVVVVWNARTAFLDHAAASMVQPQAILRQHSRAVNRLAWHPTGAFPGYLLTASQDSTIKLWERTKVVQSDGTASQVPTRKTTWFGLRVDSPASSVYSWTCRASFEPKSEAVRDVKWSPYFDDIFAVVTESGYLIVYSVQFPKTAWVRVTAHSGVASTLDWHPTRKYVIATGGASDRSVKIWDLESSMSLERRNHAQSSNTARSETSLSDSGASDGSTGEETGPARNGPTLRSMGATVSSGSVTSIGRPRNYSYGTGTLSISRHSKTATALHVLSISASVTQLLWRPSSFSYFINDIDSSSMDPHDGMLAVSTAPIKGTSSGGHGFVSLWSHHRPFMALSVMEGHQQGPVVGFVWVDTPRSDFGGYQISRLERQSSMTHEGSSEGSGSPMRKTLSASSLSMLARVKEDEHESMVDIDRNVADRLSGRIWQHVLSVGRDGRCLLQSFARGDRPIARVPPSCFAMANLSPFQSGFGSLQFFAVHQTVPSGLRNDTALTGLRHDDITAEAPGVFQEPLLGAHEDPSTNQAAQRSISGTRHPSSPMQLVFNILDQGDLDEEGNPVASESAMTIAPEVVHMSRFAESYKLLQDESCETQVELCLHNADVAERLSCGALGRMWRIVATMLKGSLLDELHSQESPYRNAMQFVLKPTIKSLLEERANAGDVQTCVVLCEVLQIMGSGSSDDSTTLLPGLDRNIVREWYLSYIDLLQQMCLFSHASFLIKTCNDSVVSALNQQSTTIHESCPHCRKPILQETYSLSNSRDINDVSVRRSCSSCRRPIGLCFLCHEPVKGVYVWCPGCGHGGHLDHALEWFGGVGESTVREFCPTGCGHRCKLTQQLRAFPRTGSLTRMEVPD